MRGQRDIGQPQQRIVRIGRLLGLRIETGRQDPPLLQRGNQRSFVYDFSTTGVDYNRRGFHLAQRLGVNQLTGALVQGHVQTHDVGGREQRGEGSSDANLRATLLENLVRHVSRMLRRTTEEVSTLAQ